jgi:hypothetical protein
LTSIAATATSDHRNAHLIGGWDISNAYDWLMVRTVLLYTRKNAQVVIHSQQTCSNAIPTSCQQDVFALLVPSLLTSSQQLVDNLSSTDFLQVVPTTCYRPANQQFVNKLWASDNLVANDQIITLLQLAIADKHASSLLTSCEIFTCVYGNWSWAYAFTHIQLMLYLGLLYLLKYSYFCPEKLFCVCTNGLTPSPLLCMQTYASMIPLLSYHNAYTW